VAETGWFKKTQKKPTCGKFSMMGDEFEIPNGWDGVRLRVGCKLTIICGPYVTKTHVIVWLRHVHAFLEKNVNS
jgi:hypothetical protein